MKPAFTQLFEQARAWCERTRTGGWLDDTALQRLAAVEHNTPADLFVDQQGRPLVVAFFGGTGVGKSSLLNRLAGAPLARTGVERPTSREVTVYLHESIQLARLAAELPLGRVEVRRHASAAQRDILWIDAPDIDSTEEANRQAALGWLPHVDLVCYVVSPERYRDDIGWRVLHERGHRHGWLFVMNRWDEGDPQQLADFAALLHEAGFQEPVVLRTSCAPGRPASAADDFDQLQTTLAALLAAHGVRELTRLGHRARLLELRTALDTALQRLGDAARWRQLGDTLHGAWDAASVTIREGAEWSLRAAAGRFAAAQGGLLGPVRRGWIAARGGAVAPVESQTPNLKLTETTPQEALADVDRLVAPVWDDWTRAKVTAALDTLELAARHANMATEPLRRQLDAAADAGAAEVAQMLRDAVRAALARPGTRLTRAARRVTGFLMVFLPILALLWVAWRVVRDFYRAAGLGAGYLGWSFAIHSGLLVLLAWAVPFLLDRLLKPSIERTVLSALRTGLRLGLLELGARLEQAFASARRAAVERVHEGRALVAQIDQLVVQPPELRPPALARVLKT
ncbi:MAG: GTPase domain-containing protein, partial [Planctomycetota bacterium]